MEEVWEVEKQTLIKKNVDLRWGKKHTKPCQAVVNIHHAHFFSIHSLLEENMAREEMCFQCPLVIQINFTESSHHHAYILWNPRAEELRKEKTN